MAASLSVEPGSKGGFVPFYEEHAKALLVEFNSVAVRLGAAENALRLFLEAEDAEAGARSGEAGELRARAASLAAAALAASSKDADG